MDSLNLSALAASLETYARDNQEHIFDQAFIPGLEGIENSPITAIAEYMTLIPATDEVVLTNIQIEDVLQPGGNGKFDPTANAVNFKVRKGKVRPVKVDVLFSQPKIISLYKSYLGQVKAKRIDPQAVPFEEYIKAAIVKKAQENIRVKALFNGVYNATGTGPLDTFDGLKSQLLEAISEGDVPAENIADIAAITDTNAVAQYEKILSIIPDAEFYSGETVCVVSRQLKEFYERDYREKYKSLPYNTSQEKGFLGGSNIPFVVEPGLSGFNRPIFTKNGNFVYLYDDAGDTNNLEIDYAKRDRSLAWIMDGQVSAGIAVAEHIWTGDAN